MTGLQTAFYIIGIIYMAISLLLIIGVVVALAVIRAKVVSLEHTITQKLEMVSSLPGKASDIFSSVRKITKRGK